MIDAVVSLYSIMFESVSYITVCFLCVELYSLLTKRGRLVPIYMVVGVYSRD